NLVQLSEIIRDAPAGFSVLSGEDALNYPILCCGGQGVISVTANLKPRLLHDMVEACQQDNYAKAREIHLHLLELNRVLFIETNPIPVKSALAEMGMISPEIRLPLCQLETANLEKLQTVMHNYKLI
ncbi:MAG: dihydrodipicolinate synthase family protein, partial [Candidatus Cloacimonetes bacterium]|nr:dihydrodipicolinate synthase family protein [Candidatus Cloacimonadota bacterium]